MSRWRVFLLLSLLTLVSAQQSFAITVHALYTSACQRQVGIIVSVNDQEVKILNLDGRIMGVPRYEVIYHVAYPIDVVPIAEVLNPEVASLIHVLTYQNGEMRTLIRGWPVDFSQDKVAFLSTSGSEIVIDRTSIWQINAEEEHAKTVRFSHSLKGSFEFIHPYAFSNCAGPSSKNKVNLIYPQQILSDPVTIKREFDRLNEGYIGLQKYIAAQKFYPVPEVYNNETYLGLWLMTNSQYGASSNRKNNFTPYLVNSFSSGPFGFQSEFRSGSGPLPQSIHEETQAQVYYALKADYFHLSAMMDPNLLLVGKKYDWTISDLDGSDVRAVESFYFEMGFDYGPFALELYTGSAGSAGARFGQSFAEGSFELPRTGLRYHGKEWRFQVIGGRKEAGAFDFSFFRSNAEWRPNHRWRWQFSYINRKVAYDGYGHESDDFIASNKANAFAAYMHYKFRARYWVGGLLAIESLTTSAGPNTGQTDKNKLLPKLGVMTAITF